MELGAQKVKSVTVVSVRGRLDAVTSPELDTFLSDLIAAAEGAILLSLGGLEYVSSAGLRSLLAAAKKLREKNRKLLFAGLQGPVEEVFRISGFYSIFKAFATEEEALREVESCE